jgi:hypothetical protein
MAQKPFVLPSGVDFYAGDGTAAGSVDPLLVVADSLNKVGINSQTPTGTLDINTASATDKGLIVRASASQTANLLEIQNAAGTALYYINSLGQESGVSNTYPSGITLLNGIPSSTTNTLYASGSYLQFNGGYVSGVTVNPLTYNSGIIGTTTNFNGSATTNISLGGSGNLTNLVVSSGITLPNGTPAVTTNNNLYTVGNQLYFNGFPVSGGIGPAGPGGASGNYGSFYDITNQTYPSTTGVIILGLGQVSEAKGVSVSGGNAVVFNYPGTYSVIYSIQFLNGAFQLQDVDVWLRKNGVDVSGSNTIFTVPGSHFSGVSGALAGSCNYVYTYNSGDYIQLASATNSTSVVVSYIPPQTNPTVPSAPSIIFTAQQVMYTQNAGTLTFGSGLSGSTTTFYNGSGNSTLNLGGTGTLNQLIFSTGTIIGDINTGSGRISPATTDIFIGNSAGNSASGTLPIFIGPSAGNSASGTSNIFIGNSAGASFPGNYNTAIGFQAANNANGVAVSGSYNTVAGYRAFRNSSGTYNVCIGYGAGGEDSNSTYDYNTALGYQAGYQASGSYNVNIGYNAGLRVYGTGNIEIRTRNTNPPFYGSTNSSNKLNIGETIVGDMLSKKIYIGDGSATGNFSPNATLQVQAKSATDKVFIAQAAVAQSANPLEVQDSFGTALISIDTLGRVSQNIAGSGTNWGNVAFGPSALGSMTQAGATNLSYNTAIGSNAMANATGCTANTCIGWYAGSAITTGNSNIIIGKTAGAAVTTQSYNTIIGDRAGQYITGGGAVAYGCLALATVSTGGDNVGVGFQAGNNITTGAGNTAIGNYSMLNSTTGVMSYNTAIGTNALRYNNASYNTALGYQALYLSSGLNANYNTALGIYAGYTVTTGSGNIFVGSSADVASSSGAINGAIVIGYGAQANQNSQLVIGSSTAKVGKSDGTGEQTATSTSPSGLTAVLETRINGTSYNIPLLPIGSTNLSAQYASGIIFSNGVVIGDINTASGRVNNQNNAIFIGNSAGISSSGGSTANGNRQVYLGYGAGAYSRYITAIGNKSDIFIGNNAASGSIGTNNIMIGDSAYINGSGQTFSVGIGYQALQAASGNAAAAVSYINAIGYQAGYQYNDGHFTSILGGLAGYQSSGQYNTFLGASAGYQQSGIYNVSIGYGAGRLNVGSGNIEIPNPISSVNVIYPLSGSYSNKINIGQVIIGDLSTRRLALGNVSSSNLSPNSTVQIIPQNATDKVLIVQGAVAQSANLLEVQNSSGSGLFSVDQVGSVYFAPWSGTSTNPIKYDGTNKRLVFTGSGTGASGINLNVLQDSTLSFEATAGQLFSISDGLSSGTIFSVNDISGMSSIEVDASGLIKIGEYDGYLGIGTSQTFGQYSGKVEINAASGYRSLILRPSSGSTTNIFEVQNSSSGALLAVTASGAISGAITPTIITSTGGLTLTDIYNGYIIEQTGIVSSGTFTIGTVTIPGWNCSIVNIGSGVIVASGSNTMRSPGGLNKSRTQYSTISIYRRASGDFVLGGDLA